MCVKESPHIPTFLRFINYPLCCEWNLIAVFDFRMASFSYCNHLRCPFHAYDPATSIIANSAAVIHSNSCVCRSVSLPDQRWRNHSNDRTPQRFEVGRSDPKFGIIQFNATQICNQHPQTCCCRQQANTTAIQQHPV